MVSFWGRVSMGLKAFREAYFASGPAHMVDFDTIEARAMRYEVFWAMYENSAYARVHTCHSQEAPLWNLQERQEPVLAGEQAGQLLRGSPVGWAPRSHGW